MMDYLIFSISKIPLERFPEFSDIRCEGVLVVEIFGKERSIRDGKVLPK